MDVIKGIRYLLLYEILILFIQFNPVYATNKYKINVQLIEINMKTINKEEIGNLDEFIELIETYKSITLELLKEKWNYQRNSSHETMNSITGFGNMLTCKLCKKSILFCSTCIYTKLYKFDNIEIHSCIHTPYYEKIKLSTSPETLYKALQGRIKFMEKLLKQIK